MSRPSVLVAYVSRAGTTKEIAEIVAAALADAGIDVDLKSVEDVADPSAYAGIVLGSAIYYGHVMPAAVNFLKKHERALAGMPLAMFSVGAEMRRETTEARAATEAIVQASLRQVPRIRPLAIGCFAGALRPDRLGFWARLVIRMMKGEAGDWRNPEAVRKWAMEIAPGLTGPDSNPPNPASAG